MHGLSVLQHLAILQLSGAFRLTAPLLRVTAGGRISHSAAATVGGSVHMLAGAAGNMQLQTSFDFFGMLSEVEAQFSVFDLNDDGIIEVDEIRSVLTELGYDPSEEELSAMVDKVDNNKNGRIDFDEFCMLMVQTAQTGDRDGKSVAEMMRRAARKLQ